MQASLKDNDLKSFLKNEALKQFDGDYDILLASVLEKQITSGQKKMTFRNYLNQKENLSFGSRTSNGGSADYNFIDSILLKYPLMQISIPELWENSTETWKTDLDEVLVTVLPSDYSEQKTNYIKAYDKDNRTYQLSLNEIPEKPVIVIGNNERLLAEKIKTTSSTNKKTSFYFQNQYYSYSFTSDEKTISKQSQITNKGNRIQSFDRDVDTRRDFLAKGRINGKEAWRQIEGWPSGRPEFKVIIVYADRSGNTITANSLEKILTKDGWVKRYLVGATVLTNTLNVDVFRWYKDRFGSNMKYRWIELDQSNQTQEITTTLTTKYDDNVSSTQTITSKISQDDDFAGESLVLYEDPTFSANNGEGTLYNTGILTFSINQQ